MPRAGRNHQRVFQCRMFIDDEMAVRGDGIGAHGDTGANRAPSSNSNQNSFWRHTLSKRSNGSPSKPADHMPALITTLSARIVRWSVMTVKARLNRDAVHAPYLWRGRLLPRHKFAFVSRFS